MKRTLLIVLMSLALFTGCGALIEDHFDPAQNETSWNTLKANLIVNQLLVAGYPTVFSTNEHFKTVSQLGGIMSKQVKYPWSASVDLHPENDTHVSYSYTLEIAAPESDIAVIQVWEIGPQGRILLPPPSEDLIKAANQALRDDPDFAAIRTERTQPLAGGVHR
jgi:hypothetical protein